MFSYARGFAPCIPAPEPEAARTEPAEQIPNGGLAFLVARLPCLWFAFSPLSPRPPSPTGKGEIKVISCKGLRPLHPRGWMGRGTGIACGKPVLSASNGALAPAGAAGTRVVKSRHSAGCLFGKDCKCRERSNAGVPGAKPPAKQTKKFFPPSPPGKGEGGIGGRIKTKGRTDERPSGHAPAGTGAARQPPCNRRDRKIRKARNRATVPIPDNQIIREKF